MLKRQGKPGLALILPIIAFIFTVSEGLWPYNVHASGKTKTSLSSSNSDKFDISQDAILQELGWTNLFDLEVFTISKKKEKLFDSATAISVVTQEDIRRSGATNIPDILRMVPGVEVIRIDSARWYVSIRGNNWEFANKLLVLVDGRSVYSEVMTGVFWKRLSSQLENIERIEVIRGPGAAIWGANAVNGVVNIITKNTIDNEGDIVTTRWGNKEEGVSYTHGARIGKDTYYRASLEYDHYDLFSNGRDVLTFQPDDHPIYLHQVHDDMRNVNGSFRIDSQPDSQNSLTIYGGLYETQSHNWEFPDYADPLITDRREDNQGGHIGANLKKSFSETSDMTFKFYLDYNEGGYSRAIKIKEKIVDAEIQYHLIAYDEHDVLLGLGARNIRDEAEEYSGTPFIPTDFDRKDTYNKYNLFFQDSFWLMSQRLKVTVGAKVENNDLTGSDFMPNLRLLYTPNEWSAIWAAASRSARVPSRYETTGAIVGLLGGNGPKDMDNPVSEKIKSYEVGYRVNSAKSWWLESTLFYQEMDNLQGPVFIVPPEPPFVQICGCVSGESYGGELSAHWRVTDSWRLEPAYSYIRTTYNYHPNSLPRPGGTFYGHRDVDNQFSIRSLYDVSDKVEFDLWYKIIDGSGVKGGNYDFLDAHINYKVNPNLDLSIVGQNLLENNSEWRYDSYHEIERSFYVKLAWRP